MTAPHKQILTCYTFLQSLCGKITTLYRPAKSNCFNIRHERLVLSAFSPLAYWRYGYAKHQYAWVVYGTRCFTTNEGDKLSMIVRRRRNKSAPANSPAFPGKARQHKSRELSAGPAIAKSSWPKFATTCIAFYTYAPQVIGSIADKLKIFKMSAQIIISTDRRVFRGLALARPD